MSAASKLRESDFALCSVLMSPHLECCVEFWLSSIRGTWKRKKGVQQMPTQMIKGLEHLLYEERLREPQLFNGRRKVQGDFLSLDLMGIKTEPNAFQWCPVVEQEAKNTNWYILNSRKNFCWKGDWKKKLPREVLETPTLTLSKAQLDSILGNLLLLTLFWSRGVGLDGL